MEQKQQENSHVKKGLIKVAILSASVVVVLIILQIINSKTNFLLNLFGFLIKK
jgi:hypothetical protein